MSEDPSIVRERAQNLWKSFARKNENVTRGAVISADPNTSFEQIGGLAGPKDELLTYACAATSPEVYKTWGTVPPSGILLVGRAGSGKSLLARALATQTGTPFIRVDVPRMVLDVVHAGGKIGELLQSWSETLEELPRVTVLFDELEFSQAQELGERRPDLPIGPVMDFLLELLDRTIRAEGHLVIGSSSHPDTLRPALLQPGRFERVVEVNPLFPADVVEALQIHSRAAEKRAGRPLFEEIDWRRAVGQNNQPSIGDWVRILHAVLRRKARGDAAGEEVGPVTTQDLEYEVTRYQQAQRRVQTESGQYV